MSKFRTILGGLAAAGMLAALSLGAVNVSSARGVHVATYRAASALSATSVCLACISADAVSVQ
jgi:hypothetical protein